MNYSIADTENLLEEYSALFECYVERVFESESVNDLMSASHWYADAFFNMLAYPQQQTRH